ncbi:MAG: hypothetical protein U9Q70_01655 [Chloroflexota bacterium]|nr:hypothetical protein [Chloroflexota bacterium]
MENEIQTSELNFWLGRWEGGWLLLPAVALGGGAYASLPTPLDELSPLALALGLLLAGWLPLWRASTATDWAVALQSWQNWEGLAPLDNWPYLQPETPGAALHQSLGQARGWWRAEGAAALSRPLRSAALAALVSLLLSAALGRTALLLTLLLLTWAELAALWNEGRGTVGSLWEALALVGLPWLLGAALTGEPLSALALLTALALTFLVSGHTRPSWRAALGAALVGLVLLWQGQAVATGLLLLLSVPGWRLALERVELSAHRAAVARWLLLMLALVAWVL